jgi:hypothetical protein
VAQQDTRQAKTSRDEPSQEGGPTLIENYQTPPDLVVKFQLIDIVAVILWLVLRLHFVYQRQIEG